MPALPRVIDKVYIAYFVFHIFVVPFLNLQNLYPPALVPDFLKAIKVDYIDQSQDPFVGEALGDAVQMAWFHAFTWMEALYQYPMFCIIPYMILKGYRSTYILMLAYAASTFTTILPCVATIWATPNTSQPSGTLHLADEHRNFLYRSYVPFMIFPLIMAVDSGLQLLKMIRQAELKVKAQ